MTVATTAAAEATNGTFMIALEEVINARTAATT